MPKDWFSTAVELFSRHAGDEEGRPPRSQPEYPDHDLSPASHAPDNMSCPIVRAEPKSLDEAAAVAEEIKRQNPVVINLEGVDKMEARRIRDFLSGVIYGLNGYISKVSTWVFICAPFDMPVEKLALDPSRSGWDRFETEADMHFADY